VRPTDIGGAENGGALMLSEDLRDRFTWSGLMVINPFATPHFALFDAHLENRAGEAPES
jgi:hypothetical protein